MADSVQIHNGDSGTGTSFTAASDDAGGAGQVQLVKLAVPTNGSAAAWGDATTGLPVEITNPGDISGGGGGSTTMLRVAANSSGLTTASTAYAVNDQLGAIVEITSAVATSGGYGTIVGAQLLDKAKIVGAVSAYLFDRSVTVASDNSAADFSDSDMENCVGILEFSPPVSAGSNALAQIEPVAYPIKSNATSLWVALVTRTAHTFFGAVSDLRLTLVIEQ